PKAKDESKTKTDPPPAPDRDALLEPLGGLAGTHLYQSYLNIGFLADATEGDVYTTAEAKKLLATVMGMMDKVDEQLGKLAGAGLAEEDQKRLARTRELSTLLRTQAKELRAYWDTPDKDKIIKADHEKKYHKAREDAWSGIRDLLGIEE